LLAGHGAGLGDHAPGAQRLSHPRAGRLPSDSRATCRAVDAARSHVPLERPVQRFSAIALVAFVLIAVSGVADAYTRLEFGSSC
jgi:hypothetical protein